MTLRTLLPHPAWSFVLALVWFALAGTFSAGHALLAVLFAVGLPLALRRTWPQRRRFRRPLLATARSFAFVGLLLVDVVVANFQVARAVLGPVRRLRPAFIAVPIDLDDERAVVLLAQAVTLTPGSLSVEVSPDRRTLLVHALHAPDPEALVRGIKDRYERRVREIYAC